jgi:tetratricopeptide (TPR) repeat protein
MKHKRKKTAGSVLLLSLLCSQVFAESSSLPVAKTTGSNENDIRLGNDLFNQGEYVQAKRHFENALAQGQGKGAANPVIYYNLGSVCYKLEQYDCSRDYFKKLLDDDRFTAVAYYNLALIENRQGDDAAAIDYLKASKTVSRDAQVVALVDQQLFKLQNVTADSNPETAQKDWHANVYLTSGYDSNIKFAPLDVASNESGTFITGIALFDKVIAGSDSGKNKPALLFTSSVFLSNYFSSDFNDYDLYDIGLRYKWLVRQWYNSIDLNVKRSTYGHVDYQQVYAASYKTSHRYSNGDLLRVRYRYQQIDSLDAIYDYLQGHQQKLSLGYQINLTSDSVYLWYELETNNRENSATRNYSPTRNTVSARYEKKFDSTNKVYAELAYRHSDYEPTQTQDRTDNRTDYVLSYEHDFVADWELLARWQSTSNRSTDSVYSYDRDVATLTLRKSF